MRDLLRRMANRNAAGATARVLAAAALSGSAITLFGLVPATEAVAQTAPPAVLSFSVTVEAPVLQITEDEPVAQFHPEGEGDYGFTYATLDPSGQHALASLLWPGAAAGNAGTLVEVLGGPSGLNALNYPVRAEAISGTTQTQQSTSAPSGTTMSATVQPPKAGDQYAAANSSLVGGGIGAVGTSGSSNSASTIHFDAAGGNLTATAQSSATGISLDGGLISIGSVTSSAQATSTNGSQPQLSGTTLVHNMSIAGQSAYVDGAGVHVGQPGNPAPAPIQDAVNTALQQAGMQVYFTSPTQVTVGGVNFFDASSVLFYWAVPNDPSHNSFTASVGGAGVSMAAASSAFQGELPGSAGSTDTATPSASSSGDSGTLPTGTAAAPQLSLPTGAAPALSSQPQIAPPSKAQLTAPANLATASLPGGLGVGWIILIALAGVVGALALTRVPGLVASASGGSPKSCPNRNRARSARTGSTQ